MPSVIDLTEERETERDRERQRKRKTGREKERERKSERDRQRDRERENTKKIKNHDSWISFCYGRFNHSTIFAIIHYTLRRKCNLLL